LFTHLQKIATKTLERLTNCSCERGCKDCYGEILGLLPKGAKDCLKVIIEDLTKITEVVVLNEELLEEIPSEQLNFKENRIFVFSDIHLTNEFCFQEEFFEALSKQSKQADVIVINGDLLDTISDESWLVFNELKAKAIKEGFWSKLVFIRSSSIHDGNLEQFSGFLHQDYAQVEINSEQVLFVHGNKIGMDANLAKKIGVEVAAIQAKKELIKSGRSWLPSITEEMHLIIGHLHQRFYNERFRVYGLGHWLQKGILYHQKCVMVIDGTKSLDEIKMYTFDEINRKEGTWR